LCLLHNTQEQGPNKIQPHEVLFGTKSNFKPEGIIFNKCKSHLWNNSKLEYKAVDSIFMGRDMTCKTDIVQPYNTRLASRIPRYAHITIHYPDDFPLLKPFVPRPVPMPSIIYDSDTEQEEEEEKINPPPSQLDPLIELGDNLDLQSAHLSL
jgi:hypothetical protein